MKRRTRVVAVASALMTLSASTVLAQVRWGSPQVPRTGACFYQNSDFRGQYFCVRSGENLPAIPRGLNDSISSIRILGNAQATVYRDVRFRGQGARFDTDVSNLKTQGWNDLISSLRVTASLWSIGRPPVWGNQAIPREGACFYTDANFRGQRFCVARGGSYRMLPPGFGDRISSIRVQRSSVMIFRDRDFSGRATRVTSNVANLRGSWNDTISSLRVF